MRFACDANPVVAVPVSCPEGTAHIFCRSEEDVDAYCPPDEFPDLNAAATACLRRRRSRALPLTA